jgi:hypothetical protein
MKLNCIDEEMLDRWVKKILALKLNFSDEKILAQAKQIIDTPPVKFQADLFVLLE